MAGGRRQAELVFTDLEREELERIVTAVQDALVVGRTGADLADFRPATAPRRDVQALVHLHRTGTRCAAIALKSEK
jgi:hypothetical protein